MSSSEVRVVVSGDKAALYAERRLPYSVDQVWAALTDPVHRRRWMGKTSIDPRVGGLVETVASGPPVPPELKRVTGRILVWDPPRVFSHEWHQAIVEPGIVRYELEPDGAGTLLRFSHHGLSVPNANGYRAGTHAFLDRLEALLGGQPMPNWATRYTEIAGFAPRTGGEFS